MVADVCHLRSLAKSSGVKGADVGGNDEIGSFSADIAHVVGLTNDTNIQQAFNNESSRHCDLIQTPSIDSYNNITLKTVHLLRLVYNDVKVNPEVIVIADDDSFINVPLLYKKIFNETIVHKTDLALYGSVIKGNRVLKPASNGTVFVGRYKCPAYMLSGRMDYPIHLSGSAYVLPYYTVDCLFLESMRLPYFHIEDALVTGFAAERCKFERKSFPGFHSGKSKNVSSKADVIFQHYVKRNDKLELAHKSGKW